MSGSWYSNTTDLWILWRSIGALHLDRLELVLLDCNRDMKRRTILDIQEIRVDLFKLLGLGDLEDRFKSGQTQLAIF